MDKLSAYQTVAECLTSVSRLMGPIAPFFSEWLFRSVNDVAGLDPSDSVHLTSFPGPDAPVAPVDDALEHRMGLARTISSVVLSLRNSSGINVRQPLERIMVVTGPRVEREAVERMGDVIRDEVNVRRIEFVAGSSSVVKRRARPDFKVLGRKLGPLMKPVNEAVRNLSDDEIESLLASGSISLQIGDEKVVLAAGEIEIESEGVHGWHVGQEGGVTVALDVTLTPELVAEGLARETVNRIQNMRKSAAFEVTDRIRIAVNGSPEILNAIRSHEAWIRNETLGLELEVADDPKGELVSSFVIDSEELTVGVRRVD
jgi:isoleucyl-tRNA synthetase